MATIQHQVTLDDKQYLAALQRIDKNIDKIASDGAKAFDSVQKSANLSGVQIGAIAGIVSSLTTAFIQMGQQAVDALIDIGEKSIETALEIDTLKARLRGIFDGSQEAADQAFTFIQRKSKELGIDLGELAGAFIPKTESLAQFERVAKIATALARSDPEQGAIGARIALIEALSGTFTSLQRRFEIPKEDISRIKEAFDTQGIEGFISALETVLAEGGKSFDDFANTASTSFARLSIAGEQIGGRLGGPIVESLQQATEKILEFINTNEDDLIVFADTIGRSIADVIDLIGRLDFSQFDTQTLIDVADYIFRIINAVELAAGQFIGLVQSFDDSNAAGNEYVFLLSNIDDALVSLAGILALTKAAFEAASAGAEPFIKRLEALAKFATGDIMGGAAASVEAFAADQTGNLIDVTAGQEAFNKSLLESQAAFKEYHDAVSGNADAQDRLRQKLDESKKAGTSAADAIQALAAANRELNEATQAAEEAQAKVNEAMAEAAKDRDRKFEDIDIAFERKRLDIQIEFAQKREDAARNNLQKLAEIRQRSRQGITDAATDLERKEEDIARKFADSRIDLEREQRESRLDIETSFREKLEDIQKQSSFDLEEAERNRDAVSFLRIIRQQQQQVSVAQTDRQREIDELRIQGERKKEELRIQQQREIQEAGIANDRKLDDLRLSLERQIEAQNIAFAQQLEDIAIGEQRKNDESVRARKRDIEDAKKAYARKIADLQESLAAELALIAEFGAKKLALLAEIAAQEAAIENQPRSRQKTVEGAEDVSSTRQGSINTQRQRATYASSRQGGINTRRQVGRQFGGDVWPGGEFIVGEKRPELFVPTEPGRIMPNLNGMAGQTVNNSSSKNINLSVPADKLSPGQRAEARQLALEVLDGVS